VRKIDTNVLLTTAISRELYHDVAKQLPVIDYHNHLSPAAIAANKRFKNITELWIYDDQYKHRLMRINGVREDCITGDATDEEKFTSWMKTFPKTMGNPLYHWSQLELQAIVSPEVDLFSTPASDLWNQCNARLGRTGLGVTDILKKWNAEILCTSDDLLDDLEPHQAASVISDVRVFPSLRSDSILHIDSTEFPEWLTKLSGLTNTTITDLDSYQQAIRLRLDVFQNAGCVLTDHALDSGFTYQSASQSEAEAIFKKVLSRVSLADNELIQIKSYLFNFLGLEYGKRRLTMQLHIGAQRKTSSRLSQIAGKYGGFATIGDPCDISSICRLLDSLECSGALPNTILYTLNPSDNERMATLTGSFAADGVSGKIQFGPAWWFNDHYDGIIRQLTDVASYGLLNSFIGMTSDSRSFLSLSRHFYFRRILCELLGSWVGKGLLPAEIDPLNDLVKNICYNNAKNLITKGNISS
jgi:glucuronate isomerase